jgi:CRP-like cAMP-binding protein
MPKTTNGTGNRLLDLLPAEESNSLLLSSHVVSLPLGHEVFRQDGPMPYVYFPTTGVFGIVIITQEGHQIEGTTIGNEGMIGLPVFLGLDFHPLTAIAQIPGSALQVPARRFLQAVKPGSRLDWLMRRYTLFRLRFASQMNVCNSLHSTEQRMCRWLLMAHDRAGETTFALTHEYLSDLLGVRRQTITIIAGSLQRAGLISYRRGILRVQDRAGLEAASCECYAAMRRLYERIMRLGPESLP